MSTNIVTFESGAQLPAYLKDREALAARAKAINADVAQAPSFAHLSIKAKVFTLVKGSERKVMMRNIDGVEEPRTSVNLTAVRANSKARVYYAKTYVEGESDELRPTCLSMDGVTPSAFAAEPQAKKCQVCPHAVWGSKVARPGETAQGTACTVNTRLAVVDPENPEVPFLLRVPAGSRKEFAAAVKALDARGLGYNVGVLRVSFDPESTLKLLFKPIGVVSDAVKDKIEALYDDEVVKEIVGVVDTAEASGDTAAEDTSELDASIAAKAAADKAKAKAAERKPAVTVTENDLDAVLAPAKAPAASAPAKATKAAPKPEVEDAVVKPATTAASAADSLLGDLDALLSSTDD